MEGRIEPSARAWPKTQEFQNHHMDSTHWNDFEFRADDIIIATWAKSGTTWLQQIVSQLIFDGAEGIPVMEVSPWVDYRAMPVQPMFEQLAAQTHRRFLKTHLAANCLVASPSAKYIYVARDGRDALWSWFEHHHAYTDMPYKVLNGSPGLVGEPFPQPIDDVVAYFHRWLDDDGYPAWPFFSNVQSWWNVRDHANVMLLHFDDLKADLEREIRKIAAFLEITPTPQRWTDIVLHCSFDYMKGHAHELNSRLDRVFKEGGKSLVNKGQNARWRSALGGADSEKYLAKAKQELSAECARWLTGNATG